MREKELSLQRLDSRFKDRKEEVEYYEALNEYYKKVDALEKERESALSMASPEADRDLIKSEYSKKLSDLSLKEKPKLSSPHETEEGKAIVRAEIDAINAKYDAKLAELRERNSKQEKVINYAERNKSGEVLPEAQRAEGEVWGSGDMPEVNRAIS